MEITETTEREAKVVIRFFLGEAVAESIAINEDVPHVLSNAIDSGASCSNAMHHLVRPPGIRPGPVYIVQQIAQAARRIRNNDSMYLICRQEVGRRFRQRLELASMNLK